MIGLNIIIKRKSDPQPAWPELNDTNSLEGDLQAVAILEKGTHNGNTCICFRVDTPHGPVLVQTTANLLNGITSALTGAELNWKDNPE